MPLSCHLTSTGTPESNRTSLKKGIPNEFVSPQFQQENSKGTAARLSPHNQRVQYDAKEVYQHYTFRFNTMLQFSGRIFIEPTLAGSTTSTALLSICTQADAIHGSTG